MERSETSYGKCPYCGTNLDYSSPRCHKCGYEYAYELGAFSSSRPHGTEDIDYLENREVSDGNDLEGLNQTSPYPVLPSKRPVPRFRKLPPIPAGPSHTEQPQRPRAQTSSNRPPRPPLPPRFSQRQATRFGPGHFLSAIRNSFGAKQTRESDRAVSNNLGSREIERTEYEIWLQRAYEKAARSGGNMNPKSSRISDVNRCRQQDCPIKNEHPRGPYYYMRTDYPDDFFILHWVECFGCTDPTSELWDARDRYMEKRATAQDVLDLRNYQRYHGDDTYHAGIWSPQF